MDDLQNLTGDALTQALSTDFSVLSNEDLTAAIEARKSAASALFGLDPASVTVAQVADVKAITASLSAAEAVDAERQAEAVKAGQEFAAARAAFATEPEAEADADAEGDDEDGDEGDAADADDATDEADADAESDTDADADAGADAAAVTTAAAIGARKIAPVSTAKKVAAANKRRDVPARAAVTLTASADVPGFGSGSAIEGVDDLTKAFMNRAKGFPRWNEKAAMSARKSSGGAPVTNAFGVASLQATFDKEVTATKGNDYAAVQAAIRQRIGNEGALTAAGWCAPSEVVYSYISDYVVDGLVTVPEVSAPRGGLMTTTGPIKSSQGAALDNFGWTQTEAQAEAGTEKPLEVIECPDFVDHRLDAVGYGFVIPFLTQKAYPEIVTDALKFASVLWAHRMNRRKINDMVALSDVRTFEGYGPSTTDALEALSILAVKERRKWNLGRTAVMEVKVPEFALEIYRADISRRDGMRADSVTDQMIMKHFTDRHLAVEFVADWQELTGTNIILPGTYDVLIFPAGTFVSALEDVVNLSAFYDTASVTVNEYTGIFFEQGYMLFKAAYGSSRVTMPVNTAGEQGALSLGGFGDKRENGSF